LRRLAQAVLVAAAGIAAAPAAAAPPDLLGTTESRVDSLDDLPQWRRVLARAEAETGLVHACMVDADQCPSRETRAWAALLGSLVGQAPLAQVDAVHRFVNGWEYRSDADNYGRSDYWATPVEFFRRAGDCEDYVIAKYVSLRALGFGADRLRMVVLQDVVRNLAHAVLAVYQDGAVYILDNLSNAVLPQDRLTHYQPYYSINESSRWAHVQPHAVIVSAATPRAGARPATR
jgi:predicted transglutaminase-like cysteine proteinase